LQHKRKYKNIEKQIKETGEKQVSTSDPESRHIMVRGSVSEVCYNVQSTVDSKNNLPVDYQVTNQNDSRAMAGMVKRAKSMLKHNRFTVLFDKGYHKGKELDAAHRLGIKTLVAIPNTPKSAQAPNPDYNAANFNFDPDSDTYTCPQGNIMTPSKRWYNTNNYRFRQYKTTACGTCPVKNQCSKSINGKIIHRSEFQPAIELNKYYIDKYPELYKQRQAIVEHPFGTLKRQWGFDYVITKKTMEKASADVGFMFIAYNLRRLFNILGRDKLQAFLEAFGSLFFPIFDKISYKWAVKRFYNTHYEKMLPINFYMYLPRQNTF